MREALVVLRQNRRGTRPLGRFLTVLLAFAIAVIGLPTLAIATAPPAEAATPGCSFAAGGGTGANRDRICWLNLADFTNAGVNGSRGQVVTQTLPGGYSFSFRMRRTSGASTAAATATPAWYSAATGEGAAIGNQAYLGIQGRPAWYVTNPSGTTDSYRISEPVLKTPTGTTLTNYALIAADAESTDYAEESREVISFGVTGSGATISVLENIASSTGTAACTGGLTSTGTAVTCTGGGRNSGALITQAGYVAGMTMNVTVTHPFESQQGFMLGIYLPTVTLKKNVNGLVYDTDRFTIRATPTGGSPVSATTTGTASATTGSAMGFIGGQLVLDEIAGSSSTILSNYSQSWSCSNTYTGSATVLPADGTSGTSVTIAPTSARDNITCTLTNTAPPPGLAIVKSASKASFAQAGEVITYSFLVSNPKGQNIKNIAVTDPLAGLSAVSCPGTTLAPSTSMTCTASYTTKASDVAAGKVENTATATGQSPSSGAVSATSTKVTVPYRAVSDVTADKVVAIGATTPFVPGRQVSWTMSITNNGPSVAVNPTLSDVVPAAVTGLSVSNVPAGWTCSIAGQNVNCNASSLAVGAKASITITGTLDPSFLGAAGDPGFLTNTATSSSSSDDPNTANNTASVRTAIAPTADVRIAKSAGSPNPLVAGSQATWTLTVTNDGPSSSVLPRVTDTLPATVSGITATTASTGWTCSVAGQTVSCGAPSLLPGASAVITVRGTVSSTATGQVDNTASVASTGTSPTPDANTANNTASSSTPVVQQADLLAVKTIASASPAIPGTAVSWQVLVTNNGPSLASGVTLTDTVPASVSGLSYTAPAGVTCSVSGQTVTCSAASLATGTSLSVTISGTLAASHTGNLVNTASVTSTTTDPVTANNTSTATTPTTPRADLVASKTHVAGTTPGEAISWSVTVTNQGPSVANAPGLSDAVPASVSGITATAPTGWACTVTGQNVNCAATAGTTMAPGASATITIAGTIAAGALDTLANTATVSSSTTDPNTANNASTATITLTPRADVRVVKSLGSASPAVAGSTVTWYVDVTNAGPTYAADFLLRDVVPAGMSGVTASLSAPIGACTVTGSTVECRTTSGNLYAGTNVRVTITGTLASTATGSLVNTATGTTSTPEVDPANNASTVTTPIAVSSDLLAVKSQAAPSPAVPGRAVSWTVTITNNGPSLANNPTLTDTVPATVTGVTTTTPAAGWTCSVGAGNAVSCSAASLAAGASITVTISGTLSPSHTSSLTNTASVSTSNTDPTPANNTSTTTTATAPQADLAITKSTPDPSPLVPGATATWTVTLVNLGPSTAAAPRISDTLPGALTGTTATLSASAVAAGWACTLSGTSLACTDDVLVPGEPVVLTISGTLAPGTTGTVTQQVSATTTTTDINPANNAASVTSDTAPRADVSVTKTLTSAAPAVPGQPVGWSVVVRNAGPSTATGVVTDDVVPAGIIGVAVSGVPPGTTCSVDGQHLTCTTATLAPGASVALTVTGTLSASHTGPLVNTATVTSATNDPAPDNNSATSTVDTAPSADLSITKSSATPNPAIPGQPVTWTLTVTNLGPSTAVNPVVSDSVSTAVGGVTATTTASGWTCSVAGQSVSCTAASLAPGASATLTVRGNLAAAHTGDLVNLASVASDTPDPVAGNNTAQATTPTTPRGDLLAVKSTASPNPAVPGQAVSWTVTITNNGPSTAVAPALSDTVAASVTGVSATVPAGSGWTCTTTGQAVGCSAASMGPGTSVTVTITGTLAASHTGPLVNTASVSSSTTDPTPANNTSTTSTPTAPSANLATTKTLTTEAVPGRAVSWTIVVTNNGPSSAVTPRVTDTVPASVSGVTATTTTPGWTCSVGAGNAVSCADDTMAPGGTATIVVSGTLSSLASGTLTNSATASSTTPDADTSDNTGTASTPMTPQADLAVAKTTSPANPVPGQEVTFTFTVENLGPSLATGIVGTDHVPDGITAIAVSTSSSTITCSVDGQDVRCTAPALPVGLVGVITIKGTLDPAFTGTLSNTGTGTMTTPDTNPDNNTSTSTTTTAPSADLVVTKSQATPNPAVPGLPASWSITLTNQGPSTAVAPSIADQLPASLTGGSLATAASGWTCAADAGTAGLWGCSGASLAPGASVTFTATGTLTPATTGTLTNRVTASAQTPDPVATNNAATSNTPTAPAADLSVVKALQGAAVPGTTVTWTLTLANAGPSAAVNASVTDIVPSSVSNIQIIEPAGGQGTCSLASQTVTCSAAYVPPGGSDVITLTGTLDPRATGDLVNTATITSGTPDPVTGNNTSTATNPKTPDADMQVTKALVGAVVPGQQVTWTLQIMNNGPSAALDKRVVDVVPAGVRVISATKDSGEGPCAISGQTVTCATDRHEAGKLVTATIVGEVDPGFRGTLSNTATVSASTPDSVPGNNSSTASATAGALVDLALTKTLSSQSPAVPGTPVSWTITASNAGPSRATGVTITDTLPPGVTGGALSTTASGWNCAGAVCSDGVIEPGTSITFTLTGDLDPARTGDLVNSVTATSIEPDASPSFNTATSTSPTAARADLEVVKSAATPNPAVPGQPISWTITVRNIGPSTATNLLMTDDLPASLTGATVTAPEGWTCTGTNPRRCTAPSLAPGASVTITIAGTLSAAATGDVVNQARIESATPDPAVANNLSVSTTPSAPQADLRITKALTSALPVVPGTPVSWDITLTNDGPSTAVAPTITDVLPAAFQSPATSVSAAGWSCGITAGTMTCLGAPLAPTGSVTVTVSGTLAGSFTGPLANTASVSSTTPDADPTDNSATDSHPTSPSADLSVDKALSGSAPVAGGSITWSVVVRNAGPSTAVAPTFTDTLPDAAFLWDVTASDPAWTCDFVVGERDITCTGPDIPANAAPVTLTIEADLDSTPTGPISNTGEVSSTTPDAAPTNNSDTATTNVGAESDLAVTKTRASGGTAGQPISWVVRVDNEGPSSALNPEITDTLPAGVTGITAVMTDSFPEDNWSCSVTGTTARCTGDQLEAFDWVEVTISGVLDSNATGSLTNTASARSESVDTVPGNNTGSDTVDVLTSAATGITKANALAGPVTPGERITYQLALTNAGPSVARAVHVRDTLPSFLTEIRADVNASGWTCAISGQDVDCVGAAVPVGAAVSITVSALLDQAHTGSFQNTATVTSDTPHPDPQEVSSTVTTEVAPRADLRMFKSVGDPSPAIAGQDVTWTLTVSNTGPSTATGVRVTDLLPAGVTPVSASGAGWTCDVTGADPTCTLATLAAQESSEVTVVGRVSPDATGTLVNAASVTSATEDPDEADNDDQSSTLVSAVADLTLAKARTTPATGNPVAGSPIGWTLTVGNQGPSAGVRPVVTDVVPAGVTGVTASAPGWACTVAGNRVTCTGPDSFPLGETASIAVAGVLGSDATGALTNAASLTATTADDDPSDNNAAVTDTVDADARVSLAKTLLPTTPLVAGTRVSFRLVVTNDGPSDARGLTVSDALPPGMDALAIESSAGWTCTPSSTSISCDRASLSANATSTIVVSALIAPGYVSAHGTGLTNVAQVTQTTPDSGGTTDDSATFTGTVTRAVDLHVTKSVGDPSPAVPGAPVTWTFTLVNNGPSAAQVVTLTETLPTGTSGGVLAMPTGWTCDQATLTCTLPELAPGVTVTGTLTADMDADRLEPLVNTVRVASDLPDTEPADDVASTSTPIGPQADLRVTKDLLNDPPVPGTRQRWVVRAYNDGPSTAVAPKISDVLIGTLSGITAQVAPTSTATGWACVVDTLDVTCDGASMAPGTMVEIVIEADLAPEVTGTLSNTVEITSLTSDPDPSDNTTRTDDVKVPRADLSVEKVVLSGEPLRVGTNVVWQITARNAGPSTAVSPVVTDTVPAPLRGITAGAVTPGWNCTVSGQDVACRAPSLAPNASAVVTITALLPADTDPSTLVVNTATIASQTADPVGENTDTTSSPVLAEAELSIRKSAATPNPVSPGEAVSWTVTVTNTGPANAVGVVSTDDVPAAVSGVTVDAGTAPWGDCRVAGQTVTCDGATLAPGTSISYVINGVLDPSFAGDLVNTAGVTSTAADPGASPNTATSTTPANGVVALRLAKDPDRTSVVAGETMTWTLTLTNDGPATALTPVVTDTPPTAVTLAPDAAKVDSAPNPSGWSCTVTPTVSCTGDRLLPGESAVVTVTGTVAADATGEITNAATATARDAENQETGTEAASTTPVGQVADLSVTKTARSASFVPGQTATWDILVRNAGPSDATGVVVTDVLPAGLTGVSAPGCTLAGGQLSCAVARIAGSETVTLTVSGTVDASQTSDVINAVTVASSTTDPEPGNDRGESSTPVAPQTDLVLVKETVTSPVVPGEAVSWRITVRNAGPSTARGIVITDTPPTVVGTIIAATQTQGFTCDPVDAGRVTCDGDALLPGASATITITGAQLDPFHLGKLPNTASVASDTDEVNPDSNTDSTDPEVSPNANVTISKVAARVAVPGEPMSWTVTASNVGPSAARGIRVTDTVPDAVTVTSATGPGWDCGATVGNAVSCAGLDLAPGASSSFTITGALDASFLGQLLNTAVIETATPGDLAEDNSATANTAVQPQADLSLAKTSPQASVVPGEDVEWTITLTNGGPSTAVDVFVRDAVDPAVTDLRVTGVSTAPDGWSCQVSGQDLTCTAASFPQGSASVTLTGRVAATLQTATLSNTATVSSASADPDTDDHTATLALPVTPRSDVALAKSSASPNPAVPGEPVSWTLTVTNQGPSLATGVVVTDVLPASISDVVASPGSGFTCTVDDQTVSCEAATLAVGQPVTIVVGGDYDPAATADLVNTASVRSTTTDPDAGNNTPSSSTPTAPSGDLRISKAELSPVFRPGELATWRITVTNEGPSTVVAPVWVDAVDAALDDASVTPSAAALAAGWDCSASAGNNLSCTAATMAPGASATFDVTVHLPAATVGQVTNLVTVTAPTNDPDLANNSARTVTSTSGLADLALTKSAPTPNPAIAGDPVSWTVTLTNKGPSTAWEPHVTDTLPNGLRDVTATASAPGWSCAPTTLSVSCSAAQLEPVRFYDPATDAMVNDPSRVVTIVITGVLASDYTGDLLNTATASSQTADADPANNDAESTAPTRTLADVAVTKSAADPAPAVPGATVEWWVTVVNNGASVARAVTMTDVVPASVSGVQATTTATGALCSVAGQRVTCTAARMDAGESFTVRVSGILDASVTGTLVNTATVSAETDDEIAGNNTATSTTTTRPITNLKLTKSQTIPNPAIAGAPVEWALTVTNPGPSTATGLALDDTVVDKVELVGVRGVPGWTCAATGQDVHCDAASLAVGASVTIFVTGTVRSDWQGTLPNTAVLTQGTYDPDTVDNTATSESPVTQRADLSIDKSAPTPATPIPGRPVSWDLVVHNAGPSLALNAQVADRIPDDVKNVTFDRTRAPDWECALDGQALTCTADTVPNGSTAVITVRGDLSPDSSGILVNAANVTSDTFDLVPGNNADVSTAETRPLADLRLEKTGPARARAGDPIEWVLTLTNDGPSTAYGPRIMDMPPLPQLRDVEATTTAPGWTCELTNTGPDCAGPAMAPGESVEVRVTATVFLRFQGEFRQNAEAYASTEDLDPDNNKTFVDTTVVAEADQSVTKALVTPAPIVAGEPVTWEIRVVNLGPSLAHDSVVTDRIPAGITDVVATTTAAFGECTEASGSLTCTIPEQSVGEDNTVIITVTGSIDPGFTGELSNTAYLTSETTDPSTGNDQGTSTVPVDSVVDLSLGVVATPDPAVAGGPIAWDFTLANAGPSDATGVRFTAKLPAGISGLRAVSVPGWTCEVLPVAPPPGGRAIVSLDEWEVTCTAERLDAGEQVVLRFEAVIDPGFSGDLAVVGSVSSDTSEPVLANNEADSATPVVGSGDLMVTKTASAEQVSGVGAEVSWQIAVTNTGPSTMFDIEVTDRMLAPAAGDQRVTCPATQLDAGESMTCTVAPYTLTQADVDAGGVTNTVLASGALPDGVAQDGAASVAVTVPLRPGVSLQKTAAYVDLGMTGADTADRIDWTFTVTNSGNTTARDVRVDDPMVPGVTCLVTVLAPGESTTCRASTTVSSAQVAAGEVRNVATAVAIAPGPCTAATGREDEPACAVTVRGEGTAVLDVPEPPRNGGRLPQTGSSADLGGLLASLVLMAVGVAIIGRNRRTQE